MLKRGLVLATLLLGLTTAGCETANEDPVVADPPVAYRYKKSIAIRLAACSFVIKPIGDGSYIVKWRCPWQE